MRCAKQVRGVSERDDGAALGDTQVAGRQHAPVGQHGCAYRVPRRVQDDGLHRATLLPSAQVSCTSGRIFFTAFSFCFERSIMGDEESLNEPRVVRNFYTHTHTAKKKRENKKDVLIITHTHTHTQFFIHGSFILYSIHCYTFNC